MANKQHVKLVWSGARQIDLWKKENPNTVLDLSKAYLRGVNLSGADLSGAVLSWADLDAADLHGADLREANLAGASLCPGGLLLMRRVNLMNANLERAVLVMARLYSVDLRGANLKGADLRGADLSGSKLDGAKISGTIYDAKTTWPRSFHLEAVREATLVFSPEPDIPGPSNVVNAKNVDEILFTRNHLLLQRSELRSRYDTMSQRIAALDIDLGRALDSLSRQVLEERRKEFADQREEIAAQMARIEEQLGK